jgi:hypothetical protein
MAPEMTLRKGVTGTTFQILLKMLSLLNGLERRIELDFPRPEFRSVRTFSSVMMREPLAEICRM